MEDTLSKRIKVVQNALSAMRSQKGEIARELEDTKKALQDAKALLEELDDPQYFYGGGRITREALDARDERSEEAWDSRDDAYKEIGRLRAALDKISKFDFPTGYSTDDMMNYAKLVIEGKENKTA